MRKRHTESRGFSSAKADARHRADRQKKRLAAKVRPSASGGSVCVAHERHERDAARRRRPHRARVPTARPRGPKRTPPPHSPRAPTLAPAPQLAEKETPQQPPSPPPPPPLPSEEVEVVEVIEARAIETADAEAQTHVSIQPVEPAVEVTAESDSEASSSDLDHMNHPPPVETHTETKLRKEECYQPAKMIGSDNSTCAPYTAGLEGCIVKYLPIGSVSDPYSLALLPYELWAFKPYNNQSYYTTDSKNHHYNGRRVEFNYMDSKTVRFWVDVVKKTHILDNDWMMESCIAWPDIKYIGFVYILERHEFRIM